MKFLLISIGTRGDVEPFLAVGELLRGRGHEVVFSFPEQLGELVPDGFGFYPLSPDFLALLESEEGRVVMGGSVGPARKLRAFYTVYERGMRVNKVLIREQYEIIEKEKPDRVIYHPKANYPLLWGLKNRRKTFLLSPVPYIIRPVDDQPHTGINRNLGKHLNRLTYRLVNFGLSKTIETAVRILPENFDLSRREIRKAILKENILFTVSPALFSPPEDWDRNARVLGYHERDRTIDWRPDAELLDFLNKNEKILFLTFGSMVNPEPVKNTRILLETLSELNAPALVNTASGGLVRSEEFADHKLFHFVEQIPYEWAFEKVYGVIHHGGSGTTHSALKAGCATLIIPHIFDQYTWNDLVSRLGAGPKGVAVGKLSKEKLKPLVADLLENGAYKTKAEEIGEKMRAENLKEELLDFVTR